MDVYEFFAEKERMCDSVKNCEECPLMEIQDRYGVYCGDAIATFYTDAIPLVAKWAAENPEPLLAKIERKLTGLPTEAIVSDTYELKTELLQALGPVSEALTNFLNSLNKL